MNPRVRGLITLAGIIVFSVVFCGLFPFFILPSLGVAVALPLIEVPGEVVSQNFLPGIPLTNTIIGTLVADAIAIGLALLAWRASKGWTNEVPGRFQGLVESFIGVFYNFMKGVGGARLRTAPLLWPLVATIFIFLLAGNWMKLVPGVETVGKMHCSHAGQIGYPAVPGIAGTATLYVNGVFSAGTRQTAETEQACVDYFHGDWSRYEQQNADAIATQVESAGIAVADAQLILSELQASLPEGDLSEAQQAELDAAVANFEKASKELERQETRQTNAALIPNLERQVTQAEQALAQAQEGEDAELISDLEEQVEAANVALNAAKTQVAFPGASLSFDAAELESGASPFLFHVTPFVRGPATDLSVAVTLALISIVSVQVYGVYSLGPAYFEKFINISALGNLGKKPLGAIDFIVGLIEIISEIGKIVSLAFRLFGNIFAGGVALIALTFLVAFIVPMVMYSLEIIIGAVQALVFAVLTLVFAAQAMESHHGDDHEHAEEH